MPFFRRIPIDVEVGGVPARWPILKNVPPPAVLDRPDCHVVRHDIDDLSESELDQRCGEPPMGLLPAEVTVDFVMVDNVVAVGTAGRGLQIGRAVEMTHTQFGQIAGGGSGIVKSETGGKLDAIGGDSLLSHSCWASAATSKSSRE